MKILLVEDDERLGKVTQELLAYEGFEAELAQDGSEAISLMKSDAGASYGS